MSTKTRRLLSAALFRQKQRTLFSQWNWLHGNSIISEKLFKERMRSRATHSLWRCNCRKIKAVKFQWNFQRLYCGRKDPKLDVILLFVNNSCYTSSVYFFIEMNFIIFLLKNDGFMLICFFSDGSAIIYCSAIFRPYPICTKIY